MINKIEQLVKMADMLIEGKVDELPKNLINFKTVLEGVKIALENESSKVSPPEVEQGAPFDDPNTMRPTEDAAVEAEVPVKRKRRTKAEMEAARAAEAKLNEVEDKIDSAMERISKASEKLDVPEEQAVAIQETVAASIKAQEVNTDTKEDWEKTLEDEINEVEVLEDESNPSISKEDQITELINKYPHPFNLAHLETVEEKRELRDDILSIKELVGNTNTADLKSKLLELNLEEGIMVRAAKFLIVLGALEADLK